jgi:hypothetical protein
MTLQELNNATQLIGKMLSAISQMNGNPAVADGMLPATSRVDMTKVVNRPSTFDGSADLANSMNGKMRLKCISESCISQQAGKLR